MDRRREYPGISSSLQNPLIQDRMAVLVAELHYPIRAKHNAMDLSVFGKDVIHWDSKVPDGQDVDTGSGD